VVDDPASVLPRAPLVRAVAAPRDGVLARLDARAVGDAAVALGAGRQRKGDAVDPAVGVVLAAKMGQRVHAGEALAWLHARDEAGASAAAERFLAGVTIADRTNGAGDGHTEVEILA
jgi:thymidine phosphorylase